MPGENTDILKILKLNEFIKIKDYTEKNQTLKSVTIKFEFLSNWDPLIMILI